MRLVSHNTMTFLKPKQFVFRWLLPFVGKCQNVDYRKQHELGAMGFDLRLYWDKQGELEYRHGLLRYKADNIDEVLSYAQEHNIIVRVLLEIRSYNEKFISNAKFQRKKFSAYCKEIEEKYPNIQFFGGVESGNWQNVLYTFKNEPKGIRLDELHGSVTSLFKSENKVLRVIDDLVPYIYARLRNKKNVREYKSYDDSVYLFLDFIEIQ